MSDSKEMKVIDQAPESQREKIARLETLVDTQADAIRQGERKYKQLQGYIEDVKKERDDMRKERDDAKSATEQRRVRFSTFVGYATAIIIVTVVSWTLYNVMSLEHPGAPSIIQHFLDGKQVNSK